MNSEFILKSSVLDLLFENRNKFYGAYNLRKFYRTRLLKSIAITLSATALVCVVLSLPKTLVETITYAEIQMSHIKEVKIQDLKKDAQKPKLKIASAFQKKLGTQILLVKNIPADTLQVLKPSDIIGSGNENLKGNLGNGLAETVVGDGKFAGVEASLPEKKTVDPNEVIASPDVMPEYPGGLNALRHFLEHNLKNPSQMEAGEMVSVNIGFVVGYNGKLQQFSIVKDGGEVYNQEVLRVVKRMPQWIPGKANGKNVAVNFTIPVKFVAAD